MSLRELCRRHGVTAHSAVVVQARQGNWAEKRRAYRDRASSTYIQQHADRAAAREAEVRDHALDAIDEAITKFRADLKATEKKLIDGEWVEVPVMRMTPRDLALLIDRFQILFGRPAMISEGRGFTATITAEASQWKFSRGSSRRPVGWRAHQPRRRRPCRDCTVGPRAEQPLLPGDGGQPDGVPNFTSVLPPMPSSLSVVATRGNPLDRGWPEYAISEG